MIPTLYTFRRCPYAMRARWAIQVAGVEVSKQEVKLRAKPEAMLLASPKGTVPVLVLADGVVIDQSLDIMLWALKQHDPENWLGSDSAQMSAMLDLIQQCELEFKPHLDRYKYPSRYRSEWANVSGLSSMPEPSSAAAEEAAFATAHFEAAQRFLSKLASGRSGRVGRSVLGADQYGLADFAIVPFVRQMARNDRPRFDESAPAWLVAWMDDLLARDDFQRVMSKPDDTAN